MLARPEHGDQLHERGILYAPDFGLNAGALIRGARFHLEGVRVPIESIGEHIGATVDELLAMAVAEDAPPARIAVREAEQRIAAARRERAR